MRKAAKAAEHVSQRAKPDFGSPQSIYLRTSWSVKPRQNPQALVESKTAIGPQARTVRLVDGRLENHRKVMSCGDLAKLMRHRRCRSVDGKVFEYDIENGTRRKVSTDDSVEYRYPNYLGSVK